MAEYRLIGHDYVPPDAEPKVTGRARFAEDFRAEGMLQARLLLSPMPHARVRRIDARAALRIDGVAAILTAADVPPVDPPGEPLLTSEPLYQGEPILSVAAEDEAAAAAALERISIDLEPLPFVIDPIDSLRPGGPDARLDGNTVKEGEVATIKWTARDVDELAAGRLPAGQATDEWSVGDVEGGLAEADLVLDETIVLEPVPHLCLEPRSALAYWQNGKLHLYGSTQSTARTIPALASWLDLDPSRIVLISEYTGGGFGSKISGSLTMCVPALLARKTGRPVKLRISRAEEHSVGRLRPGFRTRAKLGFRRDGRLVALDLYTVQANGPYGRSGDFLSAGNYASLTYQPLAIRVRGVSVFTNTPPAGAQRAPGGAQAVTMLEPLFDKAARELGMDRLAIRRINAPGEGARFGPQQRVVTSAYVREALDRGAAAFRWTEQQAASGGRGAPTSPSAAPRRVTGVGIGQGSYGAGSTGFDGLLVIRPDGRLYVHTGIGNLGTASYADTARAAAEVLGVPWTRCEVVWGDTSRHVPWSSVQAGSQTIHAHTRANYAAALDVQRKLQSIASRDLGGTPGDYAVGNERVYRRGNPSRFLTLGRAAERAIAIGGELSGQVLPDDLNPMTARAAAGLAGQGLVGVARDTLPHEGVTCSFVVAFAKVDVDVETGQVTLVDYLVVADCGTVVHPRSLGGQVHGGAVLGFGIARHQDLAVDRRWGVRSARHLYRSKPPSILDVPLEMKWDAVDLPDPFSPFGARGIGEPPVGAGASAVLCAIGDALGGVSFNRTPVTLDLILDRFRNGEPR